MPKLVQPSAKYKKSFLTDYLPGSEMQETYEMTGIAKKEVPKNFGDFLRGLKAQSKGKHLKSGFVPQSVFWLVDGNKFLGKLDVRHKLNSHLKKIGGNIGYYIRPSERGKGYGRLILKLGLKKAKALGIKNALITCDITNTRSAKVIEANGGERFEVIRQGKGLPKKLKYWVKI